MDQNSTHPVYPDDIPAMEAMLLKRGISVAEMCRNAEIAETTWGRWKRGVVSPNFKTWGSVASAYSRLIVNSHTTQTKEAAQ